MCKAWEDIIEEGREEGKLAILFDFVSDGIIDISMAASKAGVTEEEFKVLMKKAGF